ncbi:hypothetical protein M8C21_015630, partial [Ambrosia artemisiifolia]
QQPPEAATNNSIVLLSQMGKKRERHLNPEPFLSDDTTKSFSKKRTKPPKTHQTEQTVLSAGMSSKILKEALIQQKEIQEETDAQNPNNIVFPEEPVNKTILVDGDDDDVDNFAGFSDNLSQFGGYEDEINEDEEKLLEAFFSKDARPQRTLADIIVEKIKEKDQAPAGVQPLPKLDDSIIEIYKSLALMKLAEMEYGGTTSYFIKLLVEKKYALPYRVIDAMVAHFMRFCEDSRDMPVIWHQSLLAFMQRYKHELTKEQKNDINYLVKKQRHKMVTPEILRELNHSRNRGEKEDDLICSHGRGLMLRNSDGCAFLVPRSKLLITAVNIVQFAILASL